MHFVKGHGTGNDFVVLPDPDGTVDLTPDLVAAICDRRRGIGADGVLRAVRAEAAPAVAGEVGTDGSAEWFMDHRNADGGLAEMCGNGIRVYARHLVRAGLAPSGAIPILTRSGTKRVDVSSDGDVRVDMGRPEVDGPGRARIGGRWYEGLRVSLGNPHLACVLSDSVTGLDLSQSPGVDARTFPGGVNVEVVHPLDETGAEMRVHERGVGETRSCGTGAVAAAVAAARSVGQVTGTWLMDTPGGRLSVTVAGDTSYLTGPAVLVAEGELDPGSLAS